MKTCWKEEREAHSEWLKNAFEPPETPEWVGGKDPKEALEELKGRKLKNKEDPIISGESALREWLVRKSKAKASRKPDRAKALKKKQEKVHKTQDLLLTDCYNDLPDKCPLKTRFNTLQFFIDWHQFDPIITSMMFNNVCESKTRPKQYLILHRAVYSLFLKWREKGKKDFLIDIDTYRKIPALKGSGFELEEWREVIPNAPFIEFTQRWKEREDRIEEVKGRITEDTKFDSPEENRLAEMQELFSEHYDWVEKEGGSVEQEKLATGMDLCAKRLNESSGGSSVVVEIVFAFHYLMSQWCENKIYLTPTQLDIKKFLLKHLTSSKCKCWKNDVMDKNWDIPMGIAQTLISIPRGIRSK
jgi:hypothetical protein